VGPRRVSLFIQKKKQQQLFLFSSLRILSINNNQIILDVNMESQSAIELPNKNNIPK
jgi:hypothetical protein